MSSLKPKTLPTPETRLPKMVVENLSAYLLNAIIIDVMFELKELKIGSMVSRAVMESVVDFLLIVKFSRLKVLRHIEEERARVLKFAAGDESRLEFLYNTAIKAISFADVISLLVEREEE